MHLNSELLFKKYALTEFESGMRVLEIGPTGHPSLYSQYVNNVDIHWETADFVESIYITDANTHLDLKLTDPMKLPVEDSTYDIVVSGQVIEHVSAIWEWMGELKRVMKPGGKIITINPVSWPYHEAPIDCWRIYPEGIKALAQVNALQVELAIFDSLEALQLQKLDKDVKLIPGVSYAYPQENVVKTYRKIKLNRFLRRILNSDFQFPIEVSFDTISILKKL